jgi:aspartate racemase
MKTIGVLGGIGPQATMDFEQRVHRVSQQLIPQKFNTGYPPMIVLYVRHPPMLVGETGSARMPMQPDPRLLESARRLGSLADFLVIPCNSAHMLQPQIEQAAGRKVLSMIDATLDDVRRREWKRVGVLGFGDPVVYTRPLTQRGVACETIDVEARPALDAAIFQLAEGRENSQTKAVATKGLAEVRAKGVDGVILGCTELPLLLGELANGQDLIDPLQLLAEAAVKEAMA